MDKRPCYHEGMLKAEKRSGTREKRKRHAGSSRRIFQLVALIKKRVLRRWPSA